MAPGDRSPAIATDGTFTAPLYVVLNPASGQDDANETARAIGGVLNRAGRPHEIIRIGAAINLRQATAYATTAARRTQGAIVGAGGDGTLNAVARAALECGCPFGVIPQGTFNYFARAHGIPEDTDAATQALLDARIERVPVGLVNDQLFLVNASLGLYPETLEMREEQKQRHGRRRVVAWWATLLTVLREHRPMRLRIELDRQVHELSTLTLFVGLNALQLAQAGLDGTDAARGPLTAVVLRPVTRGRLLWLMLKGAMGDLAHDRGVERFAFSRLAVAPAYPRARRLKVATDGETRWMAAPLEFHLAPEPLRLLVARRGQDAGQEAR